MNTLHILFCEYHTLAGKARICTLCKEYDQAAMYADAALEILRTMNHVRKVNK